MHADAFSSTSMPPAVHPAFNEACDLAARFGARVALVDVMPELPRRAQNVITQRMEHELAEHRRALLAALAHSRPDVSTSRSLPLERR
jgi:nucleotide-binding universal stress UspA family protein